MLFLVIVKFTVNNKSNSKCSISKYKSISIWDEIELQPKCISSSVLSVRRVQQAIAAAAEGIMKNDPLVDRLGKNMSNLFSKQQEGRPALPFRKFLLDEVRSLNFHSFCLQIVKIRDSPLTCRQSMETLQNCPRHRIIWWNFKKGLRTQSSEKIGLTLFNLLLWSDQPI